MRDEDPTDFYFQQFSQRDACEIADVEMSTVNNWLQRGDFKLADAEDKRLKGRRLFAVADVAALYAMNFCVRWMDMRPAAAFIAGQIVHSSFRDNLFRPITDGEGHELTVWHLMHKTPFNDGWSIQAVWQDINTGKFYHYDPSVFGKAVPFGFPHFPCLTIPTTEMSREILTRSVQFLAGEVVPKMSDFWGVSDGI